MMHLAFCSCILAMVTCTVAGLEINDMYSEFAQADEMVQINSTLGSDSEGVVVGQSVPNKHGLTNIALGLESEGTEAVSILQVNESIKPEKGEKVPKFVDSFPGCSCQYWETKGKWKCAGTIAYPAKVAGEKCCCCGISCSPRNRCSNEQCLTIGIDQGPEVAAEQAAWEKLMKGADILIGDSTPGFITELPQGHCQVTKIIEACRKKQMTPLCDHNAYSNQHKCWTPGQPGTPFHNRHFSHWGGHRMYFGIEDDYLFYGMCFYAHNGNWALAPCNGDSHCWTNGGHNLSPNARVLATGDVKQNNFNQINQCRSKQSGGTGCWKTICVKEQPNHVR